MKVISFCLWGENPKYNIGAIKNAELAQKIYPDWICRFYIANTSVNFPPAISILETMPNVEIVRLDNYRADWGLMLARLNAASDINVEYMISRDCDSRLSLREKSAVDEWISNGTSFHTMHDHPYHSVPVLGGMFGMKCQNVLSGEIATWAHDWFINHQERWQVDQDFLAQIIWPLVKDDTLNHDQFFQHIWGGISFPDDRKDLEFVGQVFDENDITVADHKTILYKYLKSVGEPTRRKREFLK